MDIDPLADTVPPRYAIESDDEEDEYNPLPSTSSAPNTIPDVEFAGDFPRGRGLIVATGDVGKFWARGVNLEEQSGGVYVNGVQVGLVFNPEWTQATVIISEVLTRLPVWAMHKYALSLLDHLKPPRVSLLDTYPVPSYISEKPLLGQNAPLRYLATSPVVAAVESKAEPFHPPNLIQSTSAAFLATLSTSHSQSEGVLVLVPSPHIPHPLPKVIAPSNFLQLSEDRFEWPESTINSAQELLFLSINEKPPPVWVNPGAEKTVARATKKQSELGEGGMYI